MLATESAGVSGDAGGQPIRIMDETPAGDVQIDRRLGRLNMAATGIKYDIFISYRRSDRELVASVVRRQEARGVGVWYDADIDSGADWRETIVEALTNSDMLAIFFSEECNSSRQLKKELAVADALAKPVVPILIENTQPRGSLSLRARRPELDPGLP